MADPYSLTRLSLATLICYAVMAIATLGFAQARDTSQGREVLGPGDGVRITVFQNPDLTT
jgi:protein involved in polysaccharide export with SLBB domain